MSSAEFSEWLAEYSLMPFGDDWRQAALVAYWAGNAGRMAKEVTVDRLIPRVKQKRQSPHAIANTLKAFFAMSKGRQ